MSLAANGRMPTRVKAAAHETVRRRPFIIYHLIC